MKRVFLLYFNYVREDGKRDIGGIETYMYLLAKALHKQYQVHIAFPSISDFQITDETFIAHGIKCAGIDEIQKILFKKVLQPTDILIYATEQIVPVIRHPLTLAIQHGIYWDLPTSQYRNIRQPIVRQIFKLFDNYRNFVRTNHFDTLVCVDHNFISWKRTLVDTLNERRYYVILNCAGNDFFQVAMRKPDPKSLTILFPRRFVGLRGALLFAGMMSDLLHDYPGLNVILAGEGPLEDEMKRILPPGSRVRYIRADYNEMPEMMAEADVVVVPSLGSEGSSLAVAEGMAAGKMVVASNVGGINNMILHGFNGLLCRPLAEDFKNILVSFFREPEKFSHIPTNARNTAISAFSFGPWSAQWLQLLDLLVHDHPRG
jgi:glycosyltransferase involved in cell wall biosynthesis